MNETITEAMIEARIILERDSSLNNFRRIIPPDFMDTVEGALTVAFWLGYVKNVDDLKASLARLDAERIAKLGH